MTARLPLKSGDDGSSNRYEKHTWYGLRNGEIVRIAMTQTDAERALVAREVDSVSDSWPEETPFRPDNPTPNQPAHSSQYSVRVFVDGDELTLPFAIHVDRDYRRAQSLEDVAHRIAQSFVGMKYAVGDEAYVYIYAVEPNDCTADADPEPLAIARAVRRRCCCLLHAGANICPDCPVHG